MKTRRFILVIAILALCGIGILTGLYWRIVSAEQALQRSRERLAGAIDTPAFREYRRVAERDAVATGTTWPPPINFDSIPLSQTPTLPLPEASQVILHTLANRFDAEHESVNEYVAMRKTTNRSLCDWSAEDQQRVDAFMVAHGDILEPLRNLIRRGGPVPLPRWDTGARELAGYSLALRDAGRLLRVETMRSARVGDDETAMGILEDVMALSQRGEFALSPCHTRWSMSARCLSTVDLITDRGDMDSELIVRFVDSLKDAHKHQEFADSISSTLYMGLKHLDSMAERQVSPSVFQSRWENLVMISYDEPFGQTWRNRDETTLINWTMHYMSIAEKPYHEAVPLFWDAQALPDSLVISGPSLSCTEREFKSQARHEAMVDLTRLGLLIELHQKDTGALPADLEAVAPRLGGTVPVDPFTGEPYRYVLSDEDFLLYSLGGNMRDDEGFHDEYGDLVWRGRVDEELAEMRRQHMLEFFGEAFDVDLTDDSQDSAQDEAGTLSD